MQLAKEIGVKNLKAYGDSKLIVNQVREEYEVRHEDMIPYHHATINMAEKFRSFYINYVQCQKNAHADALASLAVSLVLPAGATEKYSSTTTTCTAQNSPLKKVKLQQKTFKLKKFWRLQQVLTIPVH